MKTSMEKIDKQFGQTRDHLKKIKAMAHSDQQSRAWDKQNQRFQKDLDDYSKKKARFEFLANDRNIASGKQALSGSMSGSFQERDSEVPIMKVYDQKEFIENREEQIQKLHT